MSLPGRIKYFLKLVRNVSEKGTRLCIAMAMPGERLSVTASEVLMLKHSIARLYVIGR